MENSFFEYRDKSGLANSSDSEVIEDSFTEDVTYSCKKKNRTAFVAESEESVTDDESETEERSTNQKLGKLKRFSNVSNVRVSSSSDNDGSRRTSRSSEIENGSESSDEENVSPENIPKRRQTSFNVSNDSLILRKTKKRMIFLDSDTDNSIIIEHNKNRKHACLNITPHKIDCNSKKISDVNQSMEYDALNSDNDIDTINDDKSDTSDHEDDIRNKVKRKIIRNFVSDSDDSVAESNKLSKHTSQTGKFIDDNSINGDKTVHDTPSDIENDLHQSDDDGPDEDLMVMSRATRMSIMGVIPKDNDSDESDFIHSDESSRKSRNSIAGSIEDLQVVSIRNTPEKSTETNSILIEPTAGNKASSIDDLREETIWNTPEKDKEPNDSRNKPESIDELPEVTVCDTPEKPVKTTKPSCPKADSIGDLEDVTICSTPDKSDADSTRLSCSPFMSPLHDKTNTLNHSRNNGSKLPQNKVDFIDLSINVPKHLKPTVVDLSNIDACDVNGKVQRSTTRGKFTEKENVFEDDDVTIIDPKPEIIALSSEDEDEKAEKSRTKKSHKSQDDNSISKPTKELNIKQYLVPPSFPNQVVYVQKHVRENELNKLMRLQEDLNNVRHLLEEMDMDSLPDGGSKLIERLSALEAEVRRQGDKVGNMVVEPNPSIPADVAKDEFDKGLSWDDIQKASNAVQPRMFGKQAMATHMAERNMILERLRDLHVSLGSRPADSEASPAPRALATPLLPHQRHALAWLRWRETQRPPAGILADDMGLGKTITMIALVASDKEGKIDEEDDRDEGSGRGKTIRGGTLVVCPASLIQQWAGEVTKHCKPHALSVCLHHGAARAQQPHRLATYDIVATTYNILQRDSEKNGVLMRIQWRRVILDEAHIVRNHKSATSGAVCGVLARRRWCLTGTPVQNKDLDLFALLKFMRCSPFDDLQMWKKWIDNKSLGGQERLSTIMRCILLRRTKQQLQAKGQLQSLKQRTAHLTHVTLTQQEMNVYQKVLVLSKTLFAQFLHQRAEKNSDSVGFAAHGKDTEYAKMHKKMVALQGVKPVKSHEILVLLLRLRQVCCHCGLIAGMLDEASAELPEEAASKDLLRELDKLSLEDKSKRKSMNPEDDLEDPGESAKADEAIRAVLSPNNPVFELKRPSSKIKAVMDCLINKVFVNKGDKAVVVSQWTSVLRLVETELAARKIRSVTLSGQVPVPARPRLIDALNDPTSDVKVMLLSLCAGGVGINLCGASHLLLLDPHWNPQLEEQAQDRIYRVGQAKDVHIYRFMCVDTVEQTIRKLQEAKLQLAENVLTGARNTAASSLSIEDLKMLFNMGETK